MIIYVSSSIWASPAQTIVNTVNTVGAMGKGIALQYKKKYPLMYDRYREICKAGLFEVGKLWLYKGDDRYILNFPTKKHWRNPSKPEYIEAGLKKFAATYTRVGITSISFPQLGTGHGGLDWDSVVRPMMERYLGDLPLPIYVHIVKKVNSFTPEHLVPISQAIPFETVLIDIKDLEGRKFDSLYSEREIQFNFIDGEELHFTINGKTAESVSLDFFKIVWEDLNLCRVSVSSLFQKKISPAYENVVSLLSMIKYVDVVDTGKTYDALQHDPVKALVISEDSRVREHSEQEKLPL